MLRIGLIRERKTLPDDRVAFTPKQCAYILAHYPDVQIVVEPSPRRCFADAEYAAEGIELNDNLNDCDILLGIKEVPVDSLLPGKTYFFFSHTKKKQPHNKKLMHALIEKNIRMIDYECLTHADNQRILGFGFYAGIVGAHNGLLTYGKKTGLYQLPAAHEVRSFKELIAAYEHIKLPNMKIVVTGSGKVAAGVLEVFTQLDIESVEPLDFLTHQYEYPVFTHLKGAGLYARKDNDIFLRDDFHAYPEAYKCLFSSYINQTDILMNGIYWEQRIARLFEKEEIKRNDWRIKVISDITCDVDGSVPINVGSSTIADPVYGIDRTDFSQTVPFLNNNDIIDVMAVDNLPNELPCDASQYFGTHFEKYILPEILKGDSDILRRATICENGKLTKKYEYLSDYAY
ncbi:alanine dehydrogenase [Flavipsychrobacter stenotrophus]|uniref:Alanine dehydrogenase n=1 Tax=Flavipsychrobacter stenotrophus TaxID=2077091 RepID=A0A2S7SRN4_9BACT|nr:NAD(P)-dependent oxidoreductase [Flavipsychrobacter stenotrophus]PQJ09573.1 alanine dehydrogenase [Flavipsychrobacter stenotrophus]